MSSKRAHKDSIGTDLLQVIGTATSGAFRHFKQKTADPLLASIILVGAVLGGQVGAHTNKVLPAHTISLIFGVMVFWVGVQFMFSHLIKKYERKGMKVLEKDLAHIKEEEAKLLHFFFGVEHLELKRKLLEHGVFQVSHMDIRRVFHGENYTINVPKAVIVGLLVGFFSGLMGVGGGFLAVPLMVGLLGVPMHVAVGSSLIVVIGAAASGVLIYWGEGDVAPVMALLLLAGGTLGAQVGAVVSQKLPDITLRRIFGVLMLVIGLKMLGVI
ncbi:MAG: sulfite exporter TauE/SafE family protein [Euryarchaeota archaeon]|nr:sulfite exporter TauE/SafE family protein [Euryarchaeota archaeon]